MKRYFIFIIFVGLASWQLMAAKQNIRFEQLELFNKVLYLIENQYYREVDISKLIEGAINGMMNTLDPHSSFLNEEYFKKIQDDTDGEFGGVGLQVTQKEGIVYVVTPIDDTPAYKAGIRPKDKIVEINYESIIGLTLDQAMDRMQGKIGSQVVLGISRKDVKEILHFKLKRQIIKIRPVKSYLLDSNYALIRLSQFQRRAASSFEKALKKLSSQSKKSGGLKGIILDLRSNPGGLLDQAVDLTSLFLKDGVVVSTEARDASNKDIRYVKKTGFKDLQTPIVVLVNGASASASEIVAGALQDHHRAIIAGSTTFGKGSVQTVASIDDKGRYGVKLTIAQYMTPSGRKIQAIGVSPDVPLDDLKASWVDEKKESHFIRERDLRNHLTATKETKAELKARERQERKERESKISKMNKQKQVKEGDEIFRKYDPHSDYQVLQAIKLLKGHLVYTR